MDNKVSDLQRRFQADPGNRQALHALIRGLAAAGKEAEAYHMLFDHHLVDREDPLALKLGARLSKLEVPLLSKRFGRYSRFACKSDEQLHWDYDSFDVIHKTGLPVLAIEAQGHSMVSKTLLRYLGRFPTLRLFFINQANGLSNKSVREIPPLPTLRSLALSRVNAWPKSEPITRQSFKHLCTLGQLATLRLDGCNTAPGNYELCALQPNLKALYLSFENTDASHLEFLSQLTNLKCLALHCPQYLESTLPRLAECLEALELYEMFHGANCFRSLKLPRLKHLSLKSSNIDNKHLEWIAQFDEIKTLEFDGNPYLSDNGLKPLTTMPKLERLSLRYCVGLTEKAIEVLAESPSLKILLLPQGLGGPSPEKNLKGQSSLKIINSSSSENYWLFKNSLWRQCLGRP